jgi:hypothetical protein
MSLDVLATVKRSLLCSTQSSQCNNMILTDYCLQIIFCDDSNWDGRQSPGRNIAQNSRPQLVDWENMQICHDTTVKPGAGDSLPMAITGSSDAIDNARYLPLLNAWLDGGAQGPQPDPDPFLMTMPERPNTMDLCAWYLELLNQEFIARIDDNILTTIQEQSFQDGLKGDEKAIDVLTQSLTGTFIHEVSFR